MVSMEIAKLIERCRQGDAAALGELYKTYAKQMYGVCKRYLSDKQSINDAVHDSFVVIYTSLDTLRDNSKAETWMMSIARNVASKYKDYSKALQTVSLEKLDENEILAEETQENVVKELSSSEIASLVDKLPDGYGNIFRLAVFEGMSHKEIAAQLGIEPHSSSSQLARAKKMLRSMILRTWPALLLLLIPVTLLLLRKENPVADEAQPVATTQEETSGSIPTEQIQEQARESAQEPTIVHQPTRQTNRPIANVPRETTVSINEQITPDTLTDMLAQEATIGDTLYDNPQRDTIQFFPKTETLYYELADIFPEKTVLVGDKTDAHKWSLGIAYAGNFNEQTISGMTYAADEASDGRESSAGKDEILHNDTKPISLALTVRYKQSRRFALETGISYIRHTYDIKMTINNSFYKRLQTTHYLGVPVKAVCNMATGKRWSLYGNLAITMGVPIHSQTYIVNIRRSMAENLTVTNRPATWLWLPSAGLGIQYNITRNIGIYAEPSLQYHIQTRYNIRHPFTFSSPLGIKFLW
ncbi:MAG: sigma-70 family RNA polymerase sigma factor [Bacteroidales bacterium]|nr:sigma-70 family RNA polymerase sigma factor [Bacteroidales bacterium]